MRYRHIFIISPPFYSHFNPLLALAKGFHKLGTRVTVGCSIEFKEEVIKEDLEFYELDISSNKNVGQAEKTDQPSSEKERLEEFFDATKRGAVETLITQSRHRKADMLYDPEELIEKIKTIDESLDIDLYIVDILSYSVTLSLYVLGLPFVTFCPPHPRTIPAVDEQYSVPKNWPSAIEVNECDVDSLRSVSRDTQEEFTKIFNEIISKHSPELKEIENAFSLVSPEAIVYNYLDFDDIEQEDGPKKIFIGHSFKEDKLDPKWLDKIEKYEKKILITLGTFLSNRIDVLEKLIKAVSSLSDDYLYIVSAGKNASKLEGLGLENVIIKDFVPQRALIPHMDLVIFHGGCNTFTETMYYGKPMVILPFSSDQFNIAFDAEKNNLAEILDPNNLTEADIIGAVEKSLKIPKEDLEKWSEISRKRGPDYAADILLGKR